jgi:hypothetical protein
MHKNSSGVIQQTLIRFPVSYCKNIQFSNFFLHNLLERGEWVGGEVGIFIE